MPQPLPMPADTRPTSAHRTLAPVMIDGVTTPSDQPAPDNSRALNHHSTTRTNTTRI